MSRTLAEELGYTPHLSPAMRKARRLGFAGADALVRLAVRRGCVHYTPSGYDASAVADPGRDALSDVELAAALFSSAQTYEPRLLRCAAQLLGSSTIDPHALARWAVMERAVPVVRHIAEAARTHDSGREAFWIQVLADLPAAKPPRAGILPHPSRFLSQTGIRGPHYQRQAHSAWLRPVAGRS